MLVLNGETALSGLPRVTQKRIRVACYEYLRILDVRSTAAGTDSWQAMRAQFRPL